MDAEDALIAALKVKLDRPQAHRAPPEQTRRYASPRARIRQVSAGPAETELGQEKAGDIMRPLPWNADLLGVADRVVWFEPPERALDDTIRFLTYVMTYATTEEISVVHRYVELDDFREALEQAPPGIMDERSWAYWNIVTGRYPVPPMPRRVIP
ncbi:MAG TPA: hypothetical protein VJ376_12720 [Pseudomonadota bacterium]|nr:hypothetical protein [Pseudomonadota bacterium]